ncbi:alpha/beta hydrolase [Lignipirellula cremea]|uniref:Alpha/beta hydrolase family protein n=1 Tax=Lignipirellula cremea TaxID=2528010 RepID=A0A518DLN7_9BACT|nr:alpha/beta fold hydrolase [Lignipirellula cremea]QDU92764.1 Alpha/beta hydrolase family protein [Lignipirellula cremea]
MLQRLADLLILRPSRRPIMVEGKSRRLVPGACGSLELWSEKQGEGPPDVVVLKFPGAAGRAERATVHPAECWPDLTVEVLSVNLHGYGGSDPPASVRSLPAAAEAAWRHAVEQAAGRPIILVGNSLGVVSALYLAARFPCAGLVLRNGPPLHELIVGRFGWWNFNLGARMIARQVPGELASAANASLSTAPAVFLLSGQDRIVPPRFQQPVIDAYAGEKRVVTFAQADHVDAGDAAEMASYKAALQWLRAAILPTSP